MNKIISYIIKIKNVCCDFTVKIFLFYYIIMQAYNYTKKLLCSVILYRPNMTNMTLILAGVSIEAMGI